MRRGGWWKRKESTWALIFFSQRHFEDLVAQISEDLHCCPDPESIQLATAQLAEAVHRQYLSLITASNDVTAAASACACTNCTSGNHTTRVFSSGGLVTDILRTCLDEPLLRAVTPCEASEASPPLLNSTPSSHPLSLRSHPPPPYAG